MSSLWLIYLYLFNELRKAMVHSRKWEGKEMKANAKNNRWISDFWGTGQKIYLSKQDMVECWSFFGGFYESRASLVAQLVKNPPTMQDTTCNVRNLGSIPGSGRFLGEGNGNPLHILAWEIPEQRSLVGYSPWGLN